MYLMEKYRFYFFKKKLKSPRHSCSGEENSVGIHIITPLEKDLNIFN